MIQLNSIPEILFLSTVIGVLLTPLSLYLCLIPHYFSLRFSVPSNTIFILKCLATQYQTIHYTSENSYTILAISNKSRDDLLNLILLSFCVFSHKKTEIFLEKWLWAWRFLPAIQIFVKNMKLKVGKEFLVYKFTFF